MEARRVMYEFQNRTTQYPELRCVMKVAMNSVLNNQTPRCLGAWVCRLFGLLWGSSPLQAQNPVGEWTSHVPYEEVKEVMLAGDRIVARTDLLCSRSTRLHLKSFDTPKVPAFLRSIRRPSRTTRKDNNGSSDTPTAALIFGTVGAPQNLPDFRISQVTGDKTINAITVEGDRAYLATNIGVVGGGFDPARNRRHLAACSRR